MQLHRVLHGPGHLCFHADISTHEAGAGQLTRQCLPALLVDIRKHHAGALGRHGAGGCRADPAGRAGDQHHALC